MDKETREVLTDISRKLDVLLSIQLRALFNDRDFSGSRKKGASEQVHYLSTFGLGAATIATILGSPVQSVRTLLTPGRRRK